MLRIVGQGPQMSQILCFIGHAYRLQTGTAHAHNSLM